MWKWRLNKSELFVVVAPCGPLLVSSTGDAGWSESVVSGPDNWLIPRPHKGCRLLEIAGRWPRRLESAQECVTTHLPKRATPKTDDAKASAIEEHHTKNQVFCVCSWCCAAVSLLCRNKKYLCDFSDPKLKLKRSLWQRVEGRKGKNGEFPITLDTLYFVAAQKTLMWIWVKALLGADPSCSSNYSNSVIAERATAQTDS